MNRPRRNAREGPAFRARLARHRNVERLQIPEPAVDRAEMVEGGAASEVVALDERHRQAALGCVAGDRETVDAAAHDENVERGMREAIDIAVHEERRDIIIRVATTDEVRA